MNDICDQMLMTCGGEVLTDFEGLNGLETAVYMAVQCAICVYLWLEMYDLSQKLCMLQKGMSMDCFPELVMKLRCRFGWKKWKENGQEWNLE